MHELHTHRPAIHPPRLTRSFAFDLQFRLGRRMKEAERIEIGLQISPAPKNFEYTLALAARSLEHAGRRAISRCLGSRHRSVTRIMDARHCCQIQGRNFRIALRWLPNRDSYPENADATDEI